MAGIRSLLRGGGGADSQWPLADSLCTLLLGRINERQHTAAPSKAGPSRGSNFAEPAWGQFRSLRRVVIGGCGWSSAIISQLIAAMPALHQVVVSASSKQLPSAGAMAAMLGALPHVEMIVRFHPGYDDEVDDDGQPLPSWHKPFASVRDTFGDRLRLIGERRSWKTMTDEDAEG